MKYYMLGGQCGRRQQTAGGGRTIKVMVQEAVVMPLFKMVEDVAPERSCGSHRRPKSRWRKTSHREEAVAHTDVQIKMAEDVALERGSCGSHRRPNQDGGRRRTERGSCGSHRRPKPRWRKTSPRACPCGYVRNRKTKRVVHNQAHPHNTYRGGYAVSVEKVEVNR